MRAIRFIPAVLITLIAGPGDAEETGKWRIGGGGQFEQNANFSGYVGDIYRLSDRNVDHTILQGTVSVEYQPIDGFGIGVDIGWPTKLIVNGDLNNSVWEYKTSHITVMGRYYPQAFRKISPYIGAGLIYGIHSGEQFFGEFSQNELDIENDLSPAVTAGLDFFIRPSSAIRTELSHHRSKANIIANGRKIGEIERSPIKIHFAYINDF